MLQPRIPGVTVSPSQVDQSKVVRAEPPNYLLAAGFGGPNDSVERTEQAIIVLSDPEVALGVAVESDSQFIQAAIHQNLLKRRGGIVSLAYRAHGVEELAPQLRNLG